MSGTQPTEIASANLRIEKQLESYDGMMSVNLLDFNSSRYVAYESNLSDNIC